MKVITTVGISIFSNYARQHPKFEALNFFNFWNDKKANSLKGEKVRNKANQELDAVNSWVSKIASAEIASLLEIQIDLRQKAEKKYAQLKSKPQEIKQNIDSESKVDIYLLCTDTALSVMAAECIETFFKGKEGFEVKMNEHIPSLTVKDKATFEIGLTHLFGKIESIVPKNKSNKLDWSTIALNVTGGYKALIPHLTILGQIYRCPIYYVFEETTNQKYELMQMPTLPINFDWLVAEIYGQFLSRDETLQHLLSFDSAGKDFKKLKEYGLVTESKTVDTFGKLMWQHLNSKMPESPNVLGFFVEMKVYEFFNENKGAYNLTPKRSLKLFWDGVNDKPIKAVKDDTFKHELTEIDLILSNCNNDYACVEVKAIMKIEEFSGDKVAKRADTKIKALTTFYGKPPKSFIVVAHKNSAFDISDERKQHLVPIKEQCGEIDCQFYYIDFEAKRDAETLNFTNFLNEPIRLNSI